MLATIIRKLRRKPAPLVRRTYPYYVQLYKRNNRFDREFTTNAYLSDPQAVAESIAREYGGTRIVKVWDASATAGPAQGEAR